MAGICLQLTFMLPGCAAGALLYVLLYRCRKRRLTGKGLSSSPLRELAVLLLWMYTGGMAVITLSPEPGWLYFGLQGDWTPFFNLEWMGERVSLRPFSDLDSLHNILGNILMFVPFGLFAGILRRGLRWKQALLLGLGITCFIECWQLLVGRYSDIDDVILNTLGVLLGWVLWRGCISVRDWKDRLEEGRKRN